MSKTAFAMAIPGPAASLTATPALSQANVAATPILSQANAVGQGFDIFGSFDTDSLTRPLMDSSRAPTQVFTFLGKEYLISRLHHGRREHQQLLQRRSR